MASPSGPTGVHSSDAVQGKWKCYRDPVTPFVLPKGFDDPGPSDFNWLAAQAASFGPAAVPALMLVARDGRTFRAQLCAIKALGMVHHPMAVEARRRVSLLELDGDRGRVVRGACTNLDESFDDLWDADMVIAKVLGKESHSVSSAEGEDLRQYYLQMDRLRVEAMAGNEAARADRATQAAYAALRQAWEATHPAEAQAAAERFAERMAAHQLWSEGDGDNPFFDEVIGGRGGPTSIAAFNGGSPGLGKGS